MTQETGPQPGGCRAEGLTGPARQVHQAVLTTFARTGQPPARSELERLARNLGAFDAEGGATFRQAMRGAAPDLRDFGSGEWRVEPVGCNPHRQDESRKDNKSD